MKSSAITAAAVAAISIAIIFWASYLYVSQQASTVTTTTTLSGESTLFITSGSNYYCDQSSQSSSSENGFRLQVIHSANPALGANVCFNIILNNSGDKPITVSEYTLYLNVTNGNNQVVFETFFPITQPNATLNPGQTYEGTTNWDSSQPSNGVSASAGTYQITASAVDPSGKVLLSVISKIALVASTAT